MLRMVETKTFRLLYDRLLKLIRYRLNLRNSPPTSAKASIAPISTTTARMNIRDIIIRVSINKVRE